MHKYRITVITGIEYAGNGRGIPVNTQAEAKGLVQRYANEKFGGVTTYPHVGSWPDAGNLRHEEGITFVVLADSPLRLPDARPEIHLRYVTEQAEDFAQYVRAVFDQKTVILIVETINGIVKFV